MVGICRYESRRVGVVERGKSWLGEGAGKVWNALEDADDGFIWVLSEGITLYIAE